MSIIFSSNGWHREKERDETIMKILNILRIKKIFLDEIKSIFDI